jgi:hypothetical protein
VQGPSTRLTFPTLFSGSEPRARTVRCAFDGHLTARRTRSSGDLQHHPSRTYAAPLANDERTTT